MAQHDYIISNQSGAGFRSDLNSALAAIVSQNSGSSAPSTTYAYQFWADTTAGVLKQRNAANSAWITLFQLDGEWSTIALENGTAAAPSLYFKDSGTDTGVYSPGVDQVGVATAGVQRVNFNGSTEVVFNDTGADVDFRIEGDTDPNLFVIDAGTDQVRVKNLNGGPLAGTRNRIINGDMRIDQRGATATINSSALTYAVDRWAGFGIASAGVFTLVRSTTAPSNFTNSLAASCTTADASLASTDRYFIAQAVEGNNTADLGFGTATAKTLTVSFWVQSSLTGTYCVALVNGDANRSYVAEYSINAANTWEYKTITIAGDTAGTWLTDTSVGVSLRFALAAGTTFQTTANNWAGGNFIATANQVNWMSSNTSRTFRISGVQIETGTVATPFELRSHGQELALCQRYYWVDDRVVSSATATNIQYPVTMRANPTITGAGSGFSATFSTYFGNLWASQTTLSAQTLRASAEL